MNEKKIAVIICYYGEFPWYFSLFLHSCTFNPTIDFLIFTDIEYDFEPYQNIKVFNKSIKEIEELASEKLCFKVNIEESYKLCDFKPAYGFIFSEYIEEYDYWAQSDIDIIYGNIRAFITSEMLNIFDFISIRHDYTTGCFALYKNSEPMTSLFKRSADYVKVFSDSEHYCFDECNFMHDPLTKGESIFDIETEIESFTHLVRRAEETGEIRAHFDFLLMEGVPGKIKFDHGRIIYNNKLETILYHLYWLKKYYNPKTIFNYVPNKYTISPSRIYIGRKQVV